MVSLLMQFPKKKKKKKKKNLLGFCTIHIQLCVKNDAKVLLWT